MVASEDMGVIEQQIAEWIRTFVAFPDRKLGKCVKVRLRHLSVERKPQGDIRDFPVRLEDGAEDEIDPLIHAIAEAAQSDADQMKAGLQQYAIYASYSNEPNYQPRRVFRVAASEEEFERDIAPSEPATEKGLVAQTMRHQEVTMKTFVMSLGTLITTQQRENQRLVEQNEKFAQQQVDMMLLVQDTIDNSHNRRLKEREADNHLAMKESVVGKLEALVPVIINRIAGKPVLPEVDKSFMLMGSLLESLSEEQQAQLLGGLTDAQRITLAEVLSEYEQKKSKAMRAPMSASPLAHQNRLPPPNSPSRELSVLDPPVPTPPEIMSMKERVASVVESPSPDPKIRKLEADAQAFADRFRSTLQSKKPTNGEK